MALIALISLDNRQKRQNTKMNKIGLKIVKYRTVLKNLDYSTLKMFLSVFSKPLFKGPALHLKIMQKIYVRHLNLLYRKKSKIVPLFLLFKEGPAAEH